jgi:acetylornithine/succinyldiaminopimelate/putrescine aminotransferase/cyclopropane fatty-acyl-phospholipid synthase-like methyltransferase
VESVFTGAQQPTLELLADYNRRGVPSLLLASVYVNAEAAKLGYLLSQLTSGHSAQQRNYTFFGNSTFEAVSGAIKLARHTAAKRKRAPGRYVLVVDERRRQESFFDPRGAGPATALVPNVVFESTEAAALDRFASRDWAAVLLVRSESSEANLEQCRELLELTHAQGALRMICHSELALDDARLFCQELVADVHVHGENLTENGLPYGSMTMSENAYRVWNNVRDSTLHTSTFGGNGACLAAVLGALERHGYTTEEERSAFEAIDRDMHTRIRFFRRYVNPHVAVGMEAFDLALSIGAAAGSRLQLRDGRTIFDFAGGTGANLRGHNPPDLVPEVINLHDPSIDHFARLEALLGTLTKFERAFPAVSGATAVDGALALALLANPERSKIVTFKGNYSGKTLPSLNVSKFGPQALETDREACAPYFESMEYIDPFASGSADDLRAILCRGDVALVWLEVVQGMYCTRLPAEILMIIEECKAEGGYLIGVDEVFTGVWRTGEHFLASEPVLPSCDITTLAKPLSDMTVPIGVTLVTNDVYRRACATNADLVRRLALHYRNGIASHVAHHALERIADQHEHLLLVQKTLRAGLDRLVATSSLFESVEGEGAVLRLTLSRRWFPFGRRSEIGHVMEMALSSLMLMRCDVLIVALRLFPALFADEAELADALDRMSGALRDVSPMSVYRYAAVRLASLAKSQTSSIVRRRLRRTIVPVSLRRTWGPETIRKAPVSNAHQVSNERLSAKHEHRDEDAPELGDDRDLGVDRQMQTVKKEKSSPSLGSLYKHRSKYLSVWSAFRRTDLVEFADEHARLYAEAERTGDYTAVTAAYYAVMSDLIDRSFGPNWHFCPPQHKGQGMGGAIAAGHDQLAARLGLKAGERGIDVGSGVGGWMRYAAKRTGADFIGVSIGREEVDAANRRHLRAGLQERCKTVCGDARDMSFDSNSFDGGSAIYALKYFAELKSVFHEIERVLKPGSLFVTYNIVRTANLDSHDPSGAKAVQRFEYATGMPKLPTADEMIGAAEACGMSCVENTELVGTGPWYHYFEANPLLPILIGSRTTKSALRVLENARVLPRGCARFQEIFFDGTVLGLLHGGRGGLISGSNILVFRKGGER